MPRQMLEVEVRKGVCTRVETVKFTSTRKTKPQPLGVRRWTPQVVAEIRPHSGAAELQGALSHTRHHLAQVQEGLATTTTPWLCLTPDGQCSRLCFLAQIQPKMHHLSLLQGCNHHRATSHQGQRLTSISQAYADVKAGRTKHPSVSRSRLVLAVEGSMVTWTQRKKQHSWKTRVPLTFPRL